MPRWVWMPKTWPRYALWNPLYVIPKWNSSVLSDVGSWNLEEIRIKIKKRQIKPWEQLYSLSGIAAYHPRVCGIDTPQTPCTQKFQAYTPKQNGERSGMPAIVYSSNRYLFSLLRVSSLTFTSRASAQRQVCECSQGIIRAILIQSRFTRPTHHIKRPCVSTVQRRRRWRRWKGPFDIYHIRYLRPGPCERRERRLD